MAQLDVGITWFEGMERNRYLDSGHIGARLGETRRSVGVTFVQHVLPGAPGTPYLDIGFGLPNVDRQAFVLTLAAGRHAAPGRPHSRIDALALTIPSSFRASR